MLTGFLTRRRSIGRRKPIISHPCLNFNGYIFIEWVTTVEFYVDVIAYPYINTLMRWQLRSSKHKKEVAEHLNWITQI